MNGNAGSDVVGTGGLGDCRIMIVFGATSFGSFPAACSTTPFTFRHTYRCEGITDPAWNRGNSNANGCVFTPKLRLTDNWGWCMKIGGSGTPFDIWCDQQPEAWIEFAGDVIVR